MNRTWQQSKLLAIRATEYGFILYAIAAVGWAIGQNNVFILLLAVLQLIACLFIILLVRHLFLIARLRRVITTLSTLDIENTTSLTILHPIGLRSEETAIVDFMGLLLDKLNATKHRLNEITNAMPSIIIGVTESGMITDWNTHAEAITKIPTTEALGKPLLQIYPAFNDCLQLATAALQKNNLQKHTKFELALQKEVRYFDVVAYPVHHFASKGVVIRIDDVTAQVMLEDIMLHTEKMHSIGGLAAGVAHEINNPLGAIMQGGQNVLRRLDPTLPKNIELAASIDVDINAVYKYVSRSNILEFVQGIRSSGQRAANIVQNLLQFSRASNANKAMHAIATIIDNSIELASTDYNLQKKIDFRHIKIIKDYQADLPKVFCCAMEIEQVLLNLLKNAAYALQLGTRFPTIEIKVWTEREVLIIELKDNGPGMQQEVKKKIFDPFFTTKPVGEGTGLGLSVSFNIIVERHGGALTVDSLEGIGTTFIIVLPILSVATGEIKDYIKANSVSISG